MLLPPMLPALTALIALQDVETRAEDARRRVADAPGRIAALDAQLAESTAAVEKAKAALADSQAARRELEKEAATAQQKVSKYKDQLMEAKDNRQFHALQHEIATFTTEVQRIEEQVLVRMLESDELTAALKAAEARLAADKKQVAAQRSAIESESASSAASLATLKTERDAIVKTLEPGLLATFETVMKGRKGVGHGPRRRRPVRSVPRPHPAASLQPDPQRRADHPVRELRPHPLLRAAAAEARGRNAGARRAGRVVIVAAGH